MQWVVVCVPVHAVLLGIDCLRPRVCVCDKAEGALLHAGARTSADPGAAIVYRQHECVQEKGNAAHFLLVRRLGSQASPAAAPTCSCGRVQARASSSFVADIRPPSAVPHIFISFAAILQTTQAAADGIWRYL